MISHVGASCGDADMLLRNNVDQSVPDIRGWIMIDIWEPPILKRHGINRFTQQILAHRSQFVLESIIHAPYDSETDPDRMTSDAISDPSLLRTWQRYWHDPVHRRPPLLHNLHRTRGTCQVNAELSATVLQERISYRITYPQDLVHHWHTLLERRVVHWLVLGQTWNMCLHGRALGFHALKTLTESHGLNFYVAPWGCLTQTLDPITELDLESDWLMWQPTAEGFYRLLGDRTQ